MIVFFLKTLLVCYFLEKLLFLSSGVGFPSGVSLFCFALFLFCLFFVFVFLMCLSCLYFWLLLRLLKFFPPFFQMDFGMGLIFCFVLFFKKLQYPDIIKITIKGLFFSEKGQKKGHFLVGP